MSPYLKPYRWTILGVAAALLAAAGLTLSLPLALRRVIDSFGSVTTEPDAELQELALPDQTGSPSAGSYALQTDLDGSSGYALHTVIPATSGAEYSPGTQLDEIVASFRFLTD